MYQVVNDMIEKMGYTVSFLIHTFFYTNASVFKKICLFFVGETCSCNQKGA